MRLKWVMTGLLAAMAQSPCLSAEALTLQVGRDYYAWQIASGDPQALQKLFLKYKDLPYVRIERRGKLHFLRAGFWASDALAREALAKVAPAHPLIRVAAYRPDAVLHQNWDDSLQSSVVPSVAVASATSVPAVPAAAAVGCCCHKADSGADRWCCCACDRRQAARIQSGRLRTGIPSFLGQR